MKKIDLILAFLVLAFIGGGYFWYTYSRSETPGDLPALGTQSEQKYTDSQYAISFEYPEAYQLTEAPGEEDRVLRRITLINKKDLEPRENSEGPTAITLDIVDPGSTADLLAAVQNAPSANLVLVQGDLSDATLDERPALLYRWSGLYEGQTVVWLASGKLFVASVTFISPEDPQVKDFLQILDSFDHLEG